MFDRLKKKFSPPPAAASLPTGGATLAVSPAAASTLTPAHRAHLRDPTHGVYTAGSAPTAPPASSTPTTTAVSGAAAVRPRGAAGSPLKMPQAAGPSPAWTAIAPTITQIYKNPFVKRSKNDLVMLYTKAFKALSAEPPVATDPKVREAYRVTEDIPTEERDHLRMRNVVATENNIREFLFRHALEELTKVSQIQAPKLRMRTLIETMEVYERATFLARCFAMQALDKVKHEHMEHTAAKDGCYCCQQGGRRLFDRELTFKKLAMRTFVEVLHSVMGQPLELFVSDSLWSQYTESIATEEHRLLLDTRAASEKMGMAEWFDDIVADAYEKFTQHWASELTGSGTRGAKELCEQLSKRFREDFVNAVKWLPPVTVQRMQLAAARVVDRLHDRITPGVESWLLGSQTVTLRAAYHIFALHSTKFGDVSWLPHAVRAAARAHLVSEMESAIGGSLEDCAEKPQLADPAQLMSAIFDWKRHYDEIQKSCFDGNPKLQGAVSASAKSALSGTAVLLAFMVHNGMCNKVSVENLVELFNFIFPFLLEQDVCVVNLCGNLESRLLGPGCRVEEEGQLVVGIKGKLTNSEARKLVTMVQDMMASKEDLQPRIDQAASPIAVPVQFTVLTSNCWSSTASAHTNLHLPTPFRASMAVVERVYRGLHSGKRTLRWLHHKSFVMVKTHCFNKQSFEFTMPLAAALMLHAFDQRNVDELPIDVMQEVSGVNLSSPMLKKMIDRLIGMKVLTDKKGDAAGEDGGAGSTRLLSINKGFVAKQRKINLMPKLTITVAKTAQDAAVKADRDILIQAHIVRAMKSRRAMAHLELLETVVMQLRGRFIPTTAAIKRAIETLIDKDYLVRDEDDRSIYKYLA